MRTTSAIAAPDAGHADGSPAIVQVADELEATGISICPGFLSAADVAELAQESRRRWDAGAFAPAHIGSGSSRRLRHDVRGDHVLWLDARDSSRSVVELLGRMEQLRAEINRRTYLGLFAFECHFAVYPPGAAYERHLDRFHDSDRRVVSCVVYLNDDWQVADGGCLRIHEPGAGAFDVQRMGAAHCAAAAASAHLDVPPMVGRHLDVPPLGGTLVAFLSGAYEHEVLAATRKRMSLTGWFCRRG